MSQAGKYPDCDICEYKYEACDGEQNRLQQLKVDFSLLFDNYLKDCDVSSSEQQAVECFIEYVVIRSAV